MIKTLRNLRGISEEEFSAIYQFSPSVIGKIKSKVKQKIASKKYSKAMSFYNLATKY